MWQYRAYVMDSVSSDQAIITSHRHSSMHTYTHTLCTTPSQSCLLPFYTIPILPLFNSKDFSFTCIFMRYETKYTKLLIEQFTLICMHFTKVVPLYIGMPWHGCPSITYIHLKNPIFTFNLLPISTPNKNWGRKVGVIKNCVFMTMGKL